MDDARQRFGRIERLFRETAELSPEERRAVLDRECGDDAELRREVESLLRNDSEGGDTLAATVRKAARRATDPGEGRRIGPYALERELGRGGMGVVFLARRDDDAYSKRVAIKLMRFGFEREEVTRRFRSERQILATLDHPNIARLLDGGTTDSGEPYVVMDYIEGRPVLDHGVDALPTTEQRLEIFCAICSAVQYAHDKGFVHRDIKPGNILVTPEGVPKLLDFGIAKLLDPGSSGQSVVETRTDQRLMTPEYASPEQIRGEEITPATDVYALGVLLYELLSGRHPYRDTAQGPGELERAICYADPAKPSTAVTRGATETEATTTPRHLRRRLAGDLDNIIMKALRKEPHRRYASVGELADDIRRHLDRHPVHARRPTWTYRVSMFVRRRPVHAALILTLAAGLPTVSLLGWRTFHARQASRQIQVADLLNEARWLEERRRSFEVLDKVDAVLALSPGNPLALRHRAGARLSIAMATEDPEEARRLQEAAIDDARAVVRGAPGQSWPHLLLAHILRTIGRNEQAAEARARAETLQGSRPSDDDLDFAARLALADGEFERAVELFSELIVRRPDLATAVAGRAWAYEELGRTDAAFTEYRIAAGIAPTQDLTNVDLARLSVDRGDLDGAERYVERSLEQRPGNGFALETLGSLLVRKGIRAATDGDTSGASELFRRAEAASKAGLEANPRLLFPRVNLAASLISRNRLNAESDRALLEEALAQYERVLTRLVGRLSRVQREALYTSLANSCDALIQLERYHEALDLCGQVMDASPTDAVAAYNLAGAHALLGQTEQALTALERDLELGDTDWEYLLQDPWFVALRDEPRFRRIVAEMKRRSPDTNRR